MKTFFPLLLGVLTIPAWLAAAEPDPRLAAAGYNVLKTYCYRCHGVKFDVEGYNVLNREILLNKVPEDDDKARYVVPGKPDASVMWLRAGIKKDMPPGSNAKPSAEELDILKKWIEAGAPFPAATKRAFVTEKELYGYIADDLRATPDVDRKYRRYFSLANLNNNSYEQRIGKNGKNFDDSDLRLARAAFAKLANSLSWRPDIVVPRIVDKGKAEVLLCVDLRDLGWDKRHLWVDILQANPYSLKQSTNPDPVFRELARNIYDMCGTQVPYVRVDWFLDTAARPPLYHTMLGLPNKAQEVERMLQVDVEEDFMRNTLVRAGFAESGVSKSNRLVDRHKALHGAYWKSYDFAQSVDRGNLFQNPLGPAFKGNPFPNQAFEHAGGEMIFNLPNGMQGYFLTDNVGKRIDKGPVEIVRDLKETSGSPEVVNGISCMACHEHGVIRFKDTIRNGLAVLGEPRLKVEELFPTPEKMKQYLDRDETRFMRAYEDAAASFLKVGPDQDRPIKSFPEPVGALARYYQKDLELEDVASELGYADPKELLFMIKANQDLRTRVGLGPLMQGASIKRTHWQSTEKSVISPFQNAASILELGTPHRQL